jgi:hypothetical protein
MTRPLCDHLLMRVPGMAGKAPKIRGAPLDPFCAPVH